MFKLISQHSFFLVSKRKTIEGVGQAVYENELLVNTGENRININTKLQPGIYLVKLMVDNKTSVKQISIR